MKSPTHLPVLSTRTAGLVCFWAAVLGAASGVFLVLIEPVVPEDQWSYPLDVAGFAAIQAWFAVQHVGLLLGLLALQWTGAAAGSTLGRRGHAIAAASMAALALTELAAIAAAPNTTDSVLVGVLGAAYGVVTVVLGAGLVMEGIAVLKAKAWQGWRRWIPLMLGVWVFVPMLPALALSFTGARFAIAGWMFLFAALGWALMGHGEGVQKNQNSRGVVRGRHPITPEPAP